MRQRPVRLLVVEDSIPYLDLIREAFIKRTGAHEWELRVAQDGEEALAIILGQPQPSAFVPDIILLDWNLPKVSGSEVLQQVKAHEELRKIPILIFSSSDAPRDIHEAYSHHANGFITKPMDLDVLYKIAEAIEVFWIAIAELTSFNPLKQAARRDFVVQ